jgi:hypothetical protein
MKLSQIRRYSIAEAHEINPAVLRGFGIIAKHFAKINKRLDTLEAGSKESDKPDEDPNARNKQMVANNSSGNDALARVYARDRSMDKVDTGSRNVYHKPEGHWDDV